MRKKHTIAIGAAAAVAAVAYPIADAGRVVPGIGAEVILPIICYLLIVKTLTNAEKRKRRKKEEETRKNKKKDLFYRNLANARIG